jgi:hypothetical protein
MDTLRKPFFFVALALIGVCVLVELGVGSLLTNEVSQGDLAGVVGRAQIEGLDAGERDAALREAQPLTKQARPGLAIRYLALLDGVVLFTVALVALSLVVPESVHARLQGYATCVGSCLLILLGIVLIVVALLLLLLMVGLFLAAPFGTIAYLATFGFFDRQGAAVTLSLIMLLKLGFAGFLLAANQRFILNKGLVLIVLTSLLGNVIVSFLHALPPGFLVSITDSIAAIIIAILAVIWAVVLLVGSLFAIVRGLKVA